jgi:hypothetical protein
MLTADTGGVRVVARDAARGDTHRCPECSEPVLLKRGTRVIAHFAHRAHSRCEAAGETAAHLTMKAAVAHWVPAGSQVRLEVRAVATRRADALVVDPQGRRIAVECQASPITPAEMTARTLEYNAAGIAVWWVFDLSRLSSQRCDHREVRAPEEILDHAETLTRTGGVWLSAGGVLHWGRLGDAWRNGAYYLPRTIRTLELSAPVTGRFATATTPTQGLFDLELVVPDGPVGGRRVSGDFDCGFCDACAADVQRPHGPAPAPWALLCCGGSATRTDAARQRYEAIRAGAEDWEILRRGRSHTPSRHELYPHELAALGRPSEVWVPPRV